MINQAQKNQDLWSNEFPYGKIPIFVGKKKKYVSEIIASLELLGASTTTEISNFVLSHPKSDRRGTEITKSEIQNRSKIFNKLITGRMDKKTGRKKLGKYPGLVDYGFLKKIDVKKSKKNIDTNVWFPTFKGHIVALGYAFDDSELIQFLNTASTNSLFFAYLRDLTNVTSINTVRILFLDPISELIKNGILDLNNDLRYSLWIIALQIGLEIEKTIINTSNIIYHSNLKKEIKDEASSDLKSIEVVMDNTWFDLSDIKWKEKMLDLYYSSNLEKFFYISHSSSLDVNFLYNVMQNVHQSYYATFGERVPSKYQQKIPISIRRNKKYENKKYDVPRGVFMTGLELKKFEK